MTTLKGLWPTTTAVQRGHNPFQVGLTPGTFTLGSSSLATLGFIAESLWDSFRECLPFITSCATFCRAVASLRRLLQFQVFLNQPLGDQSLLQLLNWPGRGAIKAPCFPER